MKKLFLLFPFAFSLAASNPIEIDTKIYVKDQLGNPLPYAQVSVDNQDQDGTTADENGLAQFTIKSYPTSIFDKEKIEKLTIYPNPATDHATIKIDKPEGRVQAYNTLGQLLDEAEVSNDNKLSFTTNNKLAIIKYTNKDGNIQTGKLLLEGKNINLLVQSNYSELRNKSATMEDDYHQFTLNINPNEHYKFFIIENEELLIPTGSTNHEAEIIRNAATRIINDYAGETFNTDTLRIALNNLRYTDDNDNPAILQGASIAKIRNDNLLIYDSGLVQLIFDDGENEPTTTGTMQFTKETPITINGKTLIIGKVAEARNYDINDPEYVNSRTQGNMTFFLTNEDGSFYEEITSDAQGNFTTTVPHKGDYFYGVEPNAMTHEALIKMIIDATENEEFVSAYNGSRNNALKVHMRYQDDGNGNPVPPINPARTKTWKPEYLEEGGLNHFFMNKVYDELVNQWTDEEITQEMIDTVLNVRTKQLDPVMNDFYKNGNTKIISAVSEIPSFDGMTTFHWYKNANAAGYFGKTEENGQVIRASMSVNKDYWDHPVLHNSVPTALIQEQLSAKAFYELLNSDKESALDARENPGYVTEDDKRSLEWYQIRTQMLTEDGVPEKGIWGWDIDQRVFEEAANNPYIQDFINQYATAEAQAQLQNALNKSATVDLGKVDLVYTFKTLMPGGGTATKTYTAENYREALEDENIPGLYREEIKEVFER